MEKKQKRKQIVLTIILIMLMITGMTTIVKASGDETDGKIITSEEKAEIFREYNEFCYDKLNRQEHPVWLFKEFNISLWCNQHGTDVNGFLTGEEGHYWAAIPEAHRNEAGPVAYNSGYPYHWYRRSEDCGLVENLIGHDLYTDLYEDWVEEMYSLNWCHPSTPTFITPFQGEEGIWFETGAIGKNSISMPSPEGADWGIGPVKSIEWNRIATFPVNEVQDGLFILTQQLVYEHPGDIPFEYVNLSEEQKNNAYFNPDEKQAALWELKGTGFGYFNKDGRNNDKEDRNLGLAAMRFQRFYEKIHGGDINGEDIYEDFIKAMWLDENNNVQELDDKHVTQIEDTEIEGESYKTYAYADSFSEVNTANKSHILGPFVIDYTVLDDEEDIRYNCLDATDIQGTGKSSDYGEEMGGSSRPTPTPTPGETPEPTIRPAEDENEVAQIKFDAVEKITLYNQDKKNIEELGGSFKIAYECKNGDIVDEGLERRIIDYDGKRYYEFADGEEIPAFLSQKPFYIVVFRGSMKPEDFTNFYAKIDFQYLERCDGTITEYEGKVWNYWYDLTIKPYTFSYIARGNMPGTDSLGNHICVPTTYGTSWTPKTYTWELKKAPSGEYAQKHISFLHTDFNRTYKKTSIVITSWPEPEVLPPNIELLKNCSECGPLYGAFFNVKINVTGKDFVFARDVNETFEFSAMTNTEGKIIITPSLFEQYGVYLQNLENGVIFVTFEEKQAPSGHILNPVPQSMIVQVNKGALTGNAGGYAISEDSKTVSVRMEFDNEDSGTPKIVIEKVEKNSETGELLTGVKAFFDIQVAYTENGGELNQKGELINLGQLIDKQYNVIRGQTHNGAFVLTSEDFESMKEGFSLNGYTGRVTLAIREVATADGSFVVSPKNRTIDLIYYNGYLLDYTEYTDAPVVAHHIYDNPLAEIYYYAKGEKRLSELNEQTKQYILSWVRGALKEQENADASVRMTYEDIMAWLVNYIEEKYTTTDENGNKTFNIPAQLDEWKASTMTTEYGGDEVVRITIEDEGGTPIEVPYPPVKPPKEENLLMKVAGKVFLDQRETKADGKESNGKLDEGEILLKGIEVTLYEASGKKAELVKTEDCEYRHNPTVTDENGYYEFNGVDPMNKYYVEFKYNGMEYRATTEGTEAQYNTEEWAVTSKAHQDGGVPGDYKTITADTKAYHYDEIAGLYAECADLALKQIRESDQELNMDSIRAQVQARHPSDPEIADKINYMRNIEVKAYAGYSVNGSKAQTYPHSSLGTNFIINAIPLGSGEPEVEYAGDTVKLLYPGQLQIHCGLVERAVADLSLVTDIVETTVSMNRYDTTYDYYRGEGNYHQYIYEEDYAYSTDDTREDGVAFYTEDNVHFYITYEIVLTNETSQASKVLEVVDYYNKELVFNQNGYTTTKGTHIPAITSYIGEAPEDASTLTNALGVTASSNSGYANAKGATGDYKTLYLQLNNNIAEGQTNSNKIRLTFELTGNSDNAKEVLKQYLYQEDQKDGNGYSKSWIIGNYAEINAYSTDEGYLDRDSRPGNFKIEKFEEYNKHFTEAFVKYILGGGEQASREMNMWLNRMKELQEDDAWYVGISLTNNGFVREITGNVWEAVDGDKIKNSLGLNAKYDGGSRILNYNEANKIAGIKVELVELLKQGDTETGLDGNQVVRAVTKTDENGQYTFKSYIAGDYAVRFVYGGDDSTPTSNITKNTFEPTYKRDSFGNIVKDEHGDPVIDEEWPEDVDADPLPINGQYYQSTKANPISNTTKYWYKEKDYSDRGSKENGIENSDLLTRYSDAYDDAYSRRSQMLSNITEKGNGIDIEKEKEIEQKTGLPTGRTVEQNSSDYNYQGILSVQSKWHNDPIYAYTSTMELEVEYIRPEIKGNDENEWYEYKINQIDFGVTPRAYNDVNIKKYVSNIKLYNQDKNSLSQKLEADVSFNEDGSLVNPPTEKDFIGRLIYENFKASHFQDGKIEIQYEPELLQNARLEITYKVIVNNDSLHDGDIYDTIKYIYEGGKVIAVVYYEEATDKMVYYENDELRQNAIVYHNSDDAGEYSAKCLNNENRKDKSGRIAKYKEVKGFTEGTPEIITSQVSKVIDYVNQPLQFTQNIDGTLINQRWKEIGSQDFVSARENYSVVGADAEVEYRNNGTGSGTETDTEKPLMGTLSNRIIYKPDERDTDSTPTNLYANLKPGESRADDLTLVLNLGTQTAGTTDYEYPNEIEITRLRNSAGKILDMEGYKIDYRETSKVRHLKDLEYPDDYTGEFTPTISTSRSGTIKIIVPTGLVLVDNVVGSNLGIVLVALVIFAVGLVLIRKFVLVSKK